ncbi:MAG: hypothetical protein ACYC8T_03540 [Myxococcaceae bacterium]
MEMLRSPRNKIFAASALLLVLSAAALAKGLDAVTAARWILAAAAAVGLVVWYRRARGAGARFVAPSRLTVVSRAGLAQRCGVALVEADGRTFLVVHGDGYAEVCEAPAPERRQGRRAPRRGRSQRIVKGGGR